MSPHETERLNFERQIVYARPISVLLALIAVAEQPVSFYPRHALNFLITYLIVSLLVIPAEWVLRGRPWHLPLAVDLLGLGVFLYISPFSVALWFPYLFVCYASGSRWGLTSAIPIAGVLSLALVVRAALEAQMGWMRAMGWIGLVVVTFAAGGGLAFLGDLSRRYVAENEFLTRITGTMQVDQGLAESLRLLLDELATAFRTEEAMLAFRDVDLERIFLWRLKAGESERLVPQALPLSRCDGFLLDDMDATVCWNSLAGRRLRLRLESTIPTAS